ncbi:MAG: MaoC family dehydratase [Bacteroidota bacterium]
MEFDNIAAFKAHKGQPVGTSEWVTVTQEMVNDFAKATGDFQWIHIDVERAKKESPFGGPIAHGFMSLSLIPKLMENLAIIKSAKMGVNYGLNKVRFPHPVPCGSKVRLHCTLADAEDFGENGVKSTWDATIEIEGVKKPACVAQFLSLAFE